MIPVTNLPLAVTDLAPGETSSTTTTYTIQQSDIDNGSFTNTATAVGEAIDPNGDSLGNVTDVSDDPNNPLNTDDDLDGDFEDPTTVNFDATGNITGTVFNDTNGNGVQDAGELGIPNVDVLIVDANNISQTVTTDSDGNWIATVAEGNASVNVDEIHFLIMVQIPS